MRIKRKNDVSLRLLEIFETMMRCQTTVAAAEDLGISQPAISSGIRLLEKQLGFALFDRVNHRMTPTQEARDLVVELDPIFTMLRTFETRAREVRNGTGGRLRLIATPPLGHTVVPLALKRFLADRPQVSVAYDVRRLEAVIQAVEVGSADIGMCLGLENHPAVDTTVVQVNAMVCLVPKNHPLADEPLVTPRLAARYGYVGLETNSRLGLLLQRAFEASRIPYEPQVEVRYCHTAAVLANAGIGAAIVDPFTAQFLADFDIAQKPFDPKIEVPAVIVTRSGMIPSNLARAFIEEVQTTLTAYPEREARER